MWMSPVSVGQFAGMMPISRTLFEYKEYLNPLPGNLPIRKNRMDTRTKWAHDWAKIHEITMWPTKGRHVIGSPASEWNGLFISFAGAKYFFLWTVFDQDIPKYLIKTYPSIWSRHTPKLTLIWRSRYKDPRINKWDWFRLHIEPIFRHRPGQN